MAETGSAGESDVTVSEWKRFLATLPDDYQIDGRQMALMDNRNVVLRYLNEHDVPKPDRVPDHIRALIESKGGIKLDIACGRAKQGKDWVGIDKRPWDGVDIQWDLLTFPWPLPDSCVTLALCSHFVEHIDPSKTFDFMDECWRVLQPDAQLMIATPYGGSFGFWQDPTHIHGWVEATVAYFDPEHGSRLYEIYRPKPWRIQRNDWRADGNLEIVLAKRAEEAPGDD